MKLGALIKRMKSKSLFDPTPQAPFLGYSIESLIDIVDDFEEPPRIDVPDPDDGGSSKKTNHPHRCTFTFLYRIKRPLSMFRRHACGLNLDDIPPSQCSRKSHSP